MANNEKIVEDKDILIKISSIKKDLAILRVKSSVNPAEKVKNQKAKKKEIAKLYTKLNSKKNEG